MKEGELVESGTHHELLRRDEEYAKLYNIQAQAFSDVSVQCLCDQLIELRTVDYSTTVRNHRIPRERPDGPTYSFLTTEDDKNLRLEGVAQRLSLDAFPRERT